MSKYPKIDMGNVRRKRTWKNKTPEEKAAFSAMRSAVQKETFKNNPHLLEIRRENFRCVTQEYWDDIAEEKRKEHIRAMSKGMHTAWEEGDENFPPRVANKENLEMLNGQFDIEDNLERINDYSGVITPSQLAELNG